MHNTPLSLPLSFSLPFLSLPLPLPPSSPIFPPPPFLPHLLSLSPSPSLSPLPTPSLLSGELQTLDCHSTQLSERKTCYGLPIVDPKFENDRNRVS